MFATVSTDDIFAPTIVAIPPTQAGRELMQLPNGEIRHYGHVFIGDNQYQQPQKQAVMLRSFDNGSNWRLDPVTTPTPGATIRCPWSGCFFTAHNYLANSIPHALQGNNIFSDKTETGVYLFRSDSPDGTFSCSRIYDQFLHIQRVPLVLRQRKRWIIPFEKRNDKAEVDWGILYSDNTGDSWTIVNGQRPPVHQVIPPHEGIRWLHPGCEPIVVEYADGRLQALLRTSRDHHYECFSADAGATWSEPQPSIFYAVATMPLLYSLSQGRTLAVWNNTRPLPEIDHNKQPELANDPHTRSGEWEDFFTNRDALHAAISSDQGKTWVGFREIALNSARNDSDFRSVINPYDCIDKSVHQTQALELANGKILVAYGQSASCRRITIFDPEFLTVGERQDDFSRGLGQWSVQQYVKSYAGGFRGITGHCAYNRRPGAQLMPHPDRFDREVLLIGRHADPRLAYPKEGAVWNFKCVRAGQVTVRLRLNSGTSGLRISLQDAWVNPSDPFASELAVLTLALVPGVSNVSADCLTLPADVWHELTCQWDLDGASQIVGGEETFLIKPQRACRTGISYLHLQCLAEDNDPQGVFIEETKFSETR